MGRVLALLAAGLAVMGGQAEAKHPRDVRDARSLVQRGEADGAYPTGSPRLTDIWVDPKRGRDNASGVSSKQALRTVSAAWRRIPRVKRS